jgi:hypothetical protein
MILAVCLLTLAAAAVVAHGTLLATRAEHLLVFYWGERGLFLFVRREGSRYDRIPAWGLPAVAMRFEAAHLYERLRRPPRGEALPATREVHRFARLA